MVLQGKGKNSFREEPLGVIKGLNQKIVQENFVLMGDEKIAPLYEGGDSAWSPIFPPELRAMMT